MEKAPSGGEEENAAEAQSERVQRFQFGPWVFDVNKALAIIAESPREPRMLPVVPWARFFGLANDPEQNFSLFTPLPGFSRDYAMRTDLSDPLLVATLRNHEGKEFPLLIDGMHRLFRAYTDQVTELPAYVLDAQESLAIRADTLLASQLYWPSHDSSRLLGEASESDGGGDS